MIDASPSPAAADDRQAIRASDRRRIPSAHAEGDAAKPDTEARASGDVGRGRGASEGSGPLSKRSQSALSRPERGRPNRTSDEKAPFQGRLVGILVGWFFVWPGLAHAIPVNSVELAVRWKTQINVAFIGNFIGRNVETEFSAVPKRTFENIVVVDPAPNVELLLLSNYFSDISNADEKSGRRENTLGTNCCCLGQFPIRKIEVDRHIHHLRNSLLTLTMALRVGVCPPFLKITLNL